MVKEYKSVNAKNIDKALKWKYIIRRIIFAVLMICVLGFAVHKVTGLGIYTTEINSKYKDVENSSQIEFSHYENSYNVPVSFKKPFANKQFDDIDRLFDSVWDMYDTTYYDTEIVYFGTQKAEYDEFSKEIINRDSVWLVLSLRLYPYTGGINNKVVDYMNIKTFPLCMSLSEFHNFLFKTIRIIIICLLLVFIIKQRKRLMEYIKRLVAARKDKRIKVCLICIGSLCLVWCILMAIGFVPHKTHIIYYFTQDEMKYVDMKIEKEYIEPTIPKWHIGNDYEIDSANKAILFLVARGNYDLDSKIKFEVEDRSTPRWGYNYQLCPYYKGFRIYGMYIVVSTSVSPDEDDDIYTNYDFDEPDDYTLKDRERDLDKASAHWSLKGNWVAFTHGGIDETVWYDVSDTDECDYRLCNVTYGGSMRYIIDAWTGEIYSETSTIID